MAGTGPPSNPPGRRGHGLAGGAPSGSLHGRGRAGRRQTPSIGRFTWSRTSPITSPIQSTNVYKRGLQFSRRPEYNDAWRKRC